MKRTTIFLPDSLHEKLRREAFAKRISMARLIRQKLAPPRQRASSKINPLDKIEGLLHDGRLAENIDAELYGI